jgi:Ca2+-binding RTX toxin-like protein
VVYQGPNQGQVILADVDGRNGPDLASASPFGTLVVLVNRGDGTFERRAKYSFDQRVEPIAAADMDLDGDLDLVGRSPSGTGFIMLPNCGDATFGDLIDVQQGFDPQDIVVADLDGTAGPDIVTTANHLHSDSLFAVWLQDGRPRCEIRVATIAGTNGDDRLWGTDGDDIITGLGGRDRIQAGAGDDLVCGGPGNDILRGQAGNDVIFGHEGADGLWGGQGPDWLSGALAPTHSGEVRAMTPSSGAATTITSTVDLATNSSTATASTPATVMRVATTSSGARPLSTDGETAISGQ